MQVNGIQNSIITSLQGLAGSGAATLASPVDALAEDFQQVMQSGAQRLLGLQEPDQMRDSQLAEDPNSLGAMNQKLLQIVQMLVALLASALSGKADQGQTDSVGAAGNTGASPGASGKGGIKMDGPGGFVWKPVSDSDGKLAVLLPEKFSNNVAGVTLKSADGQTLEEGRFTGIGNGNRAHFRFDKPGGGYPPGTIVEAHMKDGSTKTYRIDDPSSRYD